MASQGSNSRDPYVAFHPMLEVLNKEKKVLERVEAHVPIIYAEPVINFDEEPEDNLEEDPEEDLEGAIDKDW
ncbi:hypothetical protein ACH5RR_029835 [Cinchona calisaya]|uniref:Uncharacterized protein n=1 Tax=Cinchona calisaya TaxID=153742 RepID=A0ABD2YSU3_9GENT